MALQSMVKANIWQLSIKVNKLDEKGGLGKGSARLLYDETYFLLRHEARSNGATGLKYGWGKAEVYGLLKGTLPTSQTITFKNDVLKSIKLSIDDTGVRNFGDVLRAFRILIAHRTLLEIDGVLDYQGQGLNADTFGID